MGEPWPRQPLPLRGPCLVNPLRGKIPEDLLSRIASLRRKGKGRGYIQWRTSGWGSWIEGGARQDSRESIVWTAKRARKSSGTNSCHEEYTARISRLKDGLQVGEELAMGDEVFFVYCSIMMIIKVTLLIRYWQTTLSTIVHPLLSKKYANRYDN